MRRGLKGKSSTQLVVFAALLLMLTFSVTPSTGTSVGTQTTTTTVTTSHNVEAPLLKQTVKLDGRITGADEWADTRENRLSLPCSSGSCNDAPVQLAEISVWAKHDGTWLYLLYRVAWPSSIKWKGDYASIRYWWSRSGQPPWEYMDHGEITSEGATGDWWMSKEISPSQKWFLDTDAPPGRNNVEGKATHDGKNYWFEFRKLLDSGDERDWTFAPGETYGAFGAGSLYVEFVHWKPETQIGYQDYITLSLLGTHTVTATATTTSPSTPRTTTTSPAPSTTSRAESLLTETSAPPSVLTGMPFGTLELAGIVAAVALISSALVLMRRRRGPAQTVTLKQKVELEPPFVKETPPVAPAKETVIPQVKAPVRYCTNCGTEMLADALYCPTCASGTLSPANDRRLGLERLEHAAIQASVIVRHMEIRIGEDATIELQMINAGKKPATLVKIENVVPAGFELVSGPEPYRVVRDDLHLKGRRLDPMKTEEIELVLRPKRRGSFLLKPRIFYLDEDGNYRYHDPDPVTITVKEIGLRGWVTGPEQ